MKSYILAKYCIRGKFGGDLNLAIWRILEHTAKLKLRQYIWFYASYLFARRTQIAIRQIKMTPIISVS